MIVYPYSGILRRKRKKKKEWTVDTHNNMVKSQKQSAEQKKPDRKGYILYIPFIQNIGKTNL